LQINKTAGNYLHLVVSMLFHIACTYNCPV